MSNEITNDILEAVMLPKFERALEKLREDAVHTFAGVEMGDDEAKALLKAIEVDPIGKTNICVVPNAPFLLMTMLFRRQHLLLMIREVLDSIPQDAITRLSREGKLQVQRTIGYQTFQLEPRSVLNRLAVKFVKAYSHQEKKRTAKVLATTTRAIRRSLTQIVQFLLNRANEHYYLGYIGAGDPVVPASVKEFLTDLGTGDTFQRETSIHDSFTDTVPGEDGRLIELIDVRGKIKKIDVRIMWKQSVRKNIRHTFASLIDQMQTREREKKASVAKMKNAFNKVLDATRLKNQTATLYLELTRRGELICTEEITKIASGSGSSKQQSLELTLDLTTSHLLVECEPGDIIAVKYSVGKHENAFLALE